MNQPFRRSSPAVASRGAFAASALATFERATGRRGVGRLDLITGTSTGGILAIGLAMGTSAEEINRFYETEGPRIFRRRNVVREWLGRVRDVFRPRFS
jgi:patatin-like phospholipase/acyl hydrolase